MASGSPQSGQSQSEPWIVPLFPLPNVVLLPGAVLPLHIFEERYKVMTVHALQGDRQIAMALLLPGWEKDYYCRPKIEPVICVGTILTHEKLANGKYNFLLQGHARAKILREIDGMPYRQAVVEPLAEEPAMEIDLESERSRLLKVFTHPELHSTPMGRRIAELLAGTAVTAELVDVIAFNYLDDVCLRQQLLADVNVGRRVRMVTDAMERVIPMMQKLKRPRHSPSLN